MSLRIVVDMNLSVDGYRCCSKQAGRPSTGLRLVAIEQAKSRVRVLPL